MMNCTISGATGFSFSNIKVNYGNDSLNSTKNDILINHFNLDTTSSSQQRKKAKSHYLNKSIGAVTGIFKNILK